MTAPKVTWVSLAGGPALAVTSGDQRVAEVAPGLWLRRGAGGFEIGVVAQRGRARPARGSVPAVITAARAAVLALPLECAVVELAAQQVAEGKPLDPDDHHRLRLARERAQAARQLIADL